MIRAVVFDWGDTVMRVFPVSEGPMAHWPQVEAVPGIEAALRVLHPRCRLALATNAAESGAALVRAALARVGLEAHFDAVLTARELGVRKPDPAFFRAVLRELGCEADEADEAAMVGDDYRADVEGAKAIGMRAVWFNPSGAACPALHPAYDAEIEALADLPAVLERPFLPDLARCMVLLAGQDLPPRAVRHSQAVAAVAFYLAGRLRAAGEPVDPLLAHRGGLLHDLDKITASRLGRVHGQLGAEILRGQGYPALADVVERHLMFTLLDPARGPSTWEEKLVHYADKVVEEDRLVGLERRLEALDGRYSDYAAEIRRCRPHLVALEAQIAARLGVEVAVLRSQLDGWGQAHLEAGRGAEAGV